MAGHDVRELVQRGWSATLLLSIMVGGSAVLWVGVPLGCLWVAGRVQGATGSLGTALGAAVFAVLVGISVVIRLLIECSELHRRARAAGGREDLGQFPLEVVLVVSASIVLVLFVGWFLLFAGSSPIPVNMSL